MVSTSTSIASLPPNLSTPSFLTEGDDLQYITAYLVIHMMSDNSRRYMYILWFCIGFIFLVFTFLHLSGSRGGFIGAYWSKWAIRRRTWRGKHFLKIAQKKGQRGYPTSLPPNGQLLCLAALPIVTFLLAFVGPDYISPTIGLFDFRSSLLSAREYAITKYYQYQPQYTIQKAWWTSGGRTGLIAFCLLPLCVLFALKSPPFAIFALPYTTQLHFDKLAWLHRWSGRLIWSVAALHVGLWSAQLIVDKRESTGKMTYQYAWQYQEFIYGWIVGLVCLPFFTITQGI